MKFSIPSFKEIGTRYAHFQDRQVGVGKKEVRQNGKKVFRLDPDYFDPSLFCDPDLQPGCHGACLLLAEVHDFFRL